MEGYVGFANLPNQVFRKSVKKGFEFTVMVVGKVKFIAWTEANLQKQNNVLFHASLFKTSVLTVWCWIRVLRFLCSFNSSEICKKLR